MKNQNIYVLSFFTVLLLAVLLIFFGKLSNNALITLLICLTVIVLAFLSALVLDRQFSMNTRSQDIDQLKNDLNQSQLAMETKWRTELEAKVTPPPPSKPSLTDLVETAMKTKTVTHLEKPRRKEPNKIEELHPTMVALLKERFSSNQPLTEEE